MTRAERRLRAVVGCGLALALGACAQMGVQTGAEDGETRTAAAGGGACGAGALQDLVGTSIGELNASALPENRRVIFPGMAVTQDHVPGRLNVVVGANDEIERVYCG